MFPPKDVTLHLQRSYYTYLIFKKKMFMKKIFTLTMALLALSVTASAKYQLSLEELPNGWGSSYDAATKTITYEEAAWGGRGWGLTTAVDGVLDMATAVADYEYLVVKIQETNLTLSLAAEYTDGTFGEDGNLVKLDASTAQSFQPGATVLAIKLDPTQKYVLQAFIQNQTWSNEISGNPGGQLTLVDAFLGSEAEYQEALSSVEKKQRADVSLNASDWGKWADDITMANNDDGSLVVTFPGEWGGVNKWFGGYDATDFDYCVMEIEPADVVAQLFLQYPSGDNNNVTFAIQPGETVMKVALDERKNNISQIALQTELPGTIVLKAVYFCTEAVAPQTASEKTDVVIWSEGHEFKQWDGFALEAGLFAEATAEDKLVFVISEAYDVASQGWTWGGQILVKNSSWADFEPGIASNGENGNPEAVPAGTTNTEVVFPMDANNGALLAEAKASGLVIQGMGLTVAKVIIRKSSASSVRDIIATAATTDNAVYNLRGQRVDANYKGIIIRNGKKYLQK